LVGIVDLLPFPARPAERQCSAVFVADGFDHLFIGMLLEHWDSSQPSNVHNVIQEYGQVNSFT
jgi:hypothetical protein